MPVRQRCLLHVTILQFPTPRLPAPVERGLPLAGPAAVTGSSWSPIGSAAAFTGEYRLEGFRWGPGKLLADGIFTGELVDTDGRRIAAGSRRHSARVGLVSTPELFQAALGPLAVDIMGFVVAVDEFRVDLDWLL
jgi:hypothetical protein